MKIEQISYEHHEKIRKIAFATWPEAYSEIMDQDQMTYMLEMMYSSTSLQKQFQNGHIFWLASDDENDLGFISVEPGYRDSATAKIQKLYVLPHTQGQGIGKNLMDKAIEFAQNKNYKYLVLNVNRNNQAIDFYKKHGFDIIESNDVPIGNGYFMYDYVMQKELD